MRRLFGILLMLACSGLARLGEAQAGTLNVSFSSIPQGSVVNLTAEGTTDWVHWGLFTDTSIDRKANVAPQISNFAPVDASNGFVYIYQYSGDYAGYSWNDGTPHMSVTNTTTGLWAYGLPPIGSGFRFSVPASTNLQTLKAYVGAYAARGRFIAYLSDDSAGGYTNGNNEAVNNISNGPSAVYTVNFAANLPGQTLTIVYTLVQTYGGGGAANVTLQSAALSAPGMNNVPFVALTSPVDGSSFAQGDITLSANAGDSDGTVSLVEFYEGTNKIGEAVAAPYSMVWANPPPGSYVLTARAIDNEGGAGTSSAVTVFVSGSGGSLSGSRSTSPASVDLTLEGTADWAHWGAFDASSFNHKANGNSQISNFTLIGTNEIVRYDDNLTAFSWSDGTPLSSTNGTTTGIYVTGVTNGFEISAPADTNMRTLRVYTGLYGAQAKFEAFLSDFSGRAFTDTSLSNVFGNRFVVYKIDYAAASPGQRLIVRQAIANVYDFTYGNVTLQAATLQGAIPPETNVPPAVSITNPVNNAVFTAPATFNLEASATDIEGSVTQVEFFNGMMSLGADTTSPYGVAVDGLGSGTYTLSAVATDGAGAKSTNSISIIVSDTPVNNPPMIAITNPVNNAVFTAPATFALQATASDSDGAVSQVEFFNDASSLGVDNTSPYAVTVTDLMAGNYTFSAIATDDLGSKATNAVNVVVTNAVQPVMIHAPTVVGTTFSFTFATESDRTYAVESVATIPSTNWQVLTNIVGTGSNVTVQDSTTGAPQRFYRVLTQ